MFAKLNENIWIRVMSQRLNSLKLVEMIANLAYFLTKRGRKL